MGPQDSPKPLQLTTHLLHSPQHAWEGGRAPAACTVETLLSHGASRAAALLAQQPVIL